MASPPMTESDGAEATEGEGGEGSEGPSSPSRLDGVMTAGFVLYAVVVLGYCAYRLIVLNAS